MTAPRSKWRAYIALTFGAAIAGFLPFVPFPWRAPLNMVLGVYLGTAAVVMSSWRPLRRFRRYPKVQVPDDLSSMGVQDSSEAEQLIDLTIDIGEGTYFRDGKLGTEYVLLVNLSLGTAGPRGAGSDVTTHNVLMSESHAALFLGSFVMALRDLKHHKEHHQGT